jgi:hypothetical protein
MRRTDGPFPVWEILAGQLYQRGKLHSLPPDRKLDGLLHYGITTMVTLAPTFPDPDLVRWEETLFHYTHFPIPDGRLRAAEQLEGMAVMLATTIRDGGTVLTMCNAGRNRSGLLSALIVRELVGLSGSAALAHVRVQRPEAIANPVFESFLRSLP